MRTSLNFAAPRARHPRRRAARLSWLLAALLLAAPLAPAAETPAAAALLERARWWAARDRPDLSREALLRLARIAPEHVDALALLAELELRGGAPAAATAAIERLRARAPNYPDLARLDSLLRLEGPDKGKLRDARLLAKGGRTEAAVEALTALYPKGPPSADLALEYWQLTAATPNGWVPAQAGLLRLTQQQPQNLRYRFALAEHELAHSPLNLGALRRVIEMAKLPEFASPAKSAWRRAMLRHEPQAQTQALLREYLVSDPADTAVRERLTALAAPLDPNRQGAGEPALGAAAQGQAALDRGELSAAEGLLTRALAQRPDDVDVLGALGNLRLRQGRHAQSQTHFDRAAQLDRERTSKWRGLSQTAQQRRALRGSEEALERGDAPSAERLAAYALRFDANEPDALLALGRAQWRRGALAQAEASLRAALRAEPTHAGAFRSLVRLLGERADSAGVERLIAGLTPSQKSAFAKVLAGVQRDRLREEARQLAASGRSEAAVATLQRAIELDPTDPWLRYSLARLHADRGAPELGRALLTERTRGDKPDAEALHALALFESQVGDDLGALRALERIAPGERSATMARTQLRLRLRVQLQQVQAAARAGNSAQVARLLREAQATVAGDLDLSLAVAEAWVDAGDAAQARQLADRLPWTAATPATTRLRHAALLRRVGAFGEMAPLLDQIGATPGLGEPERQDLHALRDALALHTAGKLREQGRPQAALDVLRQRGGDPPVRSAILLAHADLLRAMGRSKATLPNDPQAAAFDPVDGQVHQALLNSLASADERAEAQRQIDTHLRQSATAATADLDKRVALAGSLAELGQLAAARIALDEIVASAPGHAGAWRVLAQLELREGRHEQAIELLQRAAAADWDARAASGAMRPISRLALQAAAEGEAASPALHITRTDAGAAQAESNAWGPYRPLADWMVRQSPGSAAAIDWRFRSGSDGKSKFDAREMPLEYARPLSGDARLVVRADLVRLDAGSVDLGDARNAGEFGTLLLCQGGCAGEVFAQNASGLALNAAYERGGLHVDLGSTPLGFALQRPVGGLRYKGDLGAGSYSIDVSSRPVTASLLSYAGTRDPRTGQLWGGVQASGVRLGLSRDEGLAIGVWSSFGLHQLHGKNVQSNQRRSAMGGLYWRAINDDNQVLSVGVNAIAQGFTQNSGEFSFGHGGYYSPQSYRSLSLPLSFAQRSGRWSYSLRAAVSQSRSSGDSAAFFPTDAGLQATAQALSASNGIDPHYSGGRGRGSGRSLAAALEAQLSPQLFAGARLEIERSQDYAPNRAIFYMRFAPGEAALQTVAFPPAPVLPTSEY